MGSERGFVFNSQLNKKNLVDDEILSLVTPGQPNRFGKLYSRRGKRVMETESKEKGGKGM